MDRFETEGTERTNVPGYHYHNDRSSLMTIMTVMTRCTVIRINHRPATAANGRLAANQSQQLRHYLPPHLILGTCLSPKSKSLKNSHPSLTFWGSRFWDQGSVQCHKSFFGSLYHSFLTFWGSEFKEVSYVINPYSDHCVCLHFMSTT